MILNELENKYKALLILVDYPIAIRTFRPENEHRRK